MRRFLEEEVDWNSQDSILELMIAYGFYSTPTENQWEALDKLVETGLVVRLDSMYPNITNAAYTYVLNDEDGLALAKKYVESLS